ncbi:type IVB secretion system protein IcmH/DotU [Pseudomonas sp. UL073]|uniref:Type IVB secretion system protein IcmH/DotU n=1 Tax=Zestomonas insulae TaxID=2809017 RepID=A0ABS2IL02_9GAMM|nr:type IVB secretion system protein IcmH/DotU [Pseudomonas insulae]MBM7063373.1 type IVB secretion system protein IcmH/DotU [Pseudomonas insulae]
MHDRDYQDDRTVLLDPADADQPRRPLGDVAVPPRYEQLEERMRLAARLRPAECFNFSLNPLVGAATPLLASLVRLRHGAGDETLDTLQERLVGEVKQFEYRALQDGGENSQVLAARYVLCTVLDEAVSTTPWGDAGEWSRMSLLSRFHNETFGGEKVFQLLERLSANPLKHLPMLELLYLCLALGFEGKYRVLSRGAQALELLRDELYRSIRQLRGEVPRELSPHGLGSPARGQRLVRIVPWWLIGLFTLTCLASLYGVFAWVLGEQRAAVLRPYQTLDVPHVAPQ